MDDQINIPHKKQAISPLRFFIYWILLYLGISLLGDIVWSIPTLSSILFRLVGSLSQWVDIGDYLWRPLIVISINSISLILFYWLQKRLITRLFHIELKRWVFFTWLGWAATYTVMDTVRIIWRGYSSDNVTDFNIRFTVVLILTTALIQWWLLRRQLRFTWGWLAAHLAFLLGATLFVGRYVYYTIQLYSTPIIEPLDEYITLKFMAIVFGVVTGAALLWIHGAQSKAKITETNPIKLVS